MKKALIISTTLSIILLAALIFLLAKEKNAGSASSQVSLKSPQDKSCCDDPGAGAKSDNSIYQLESAWKNELGERVTLDKLKGKKQVMAMIFASCTYACPLIVNDMKKIESLVKRDDVNFLLISIDPQRDTPAALLKYAENNKLDLKKWTLLTGDENGVSELAAVLGFKYKKEPDGSFSHSNIINLLDEAGEVKFQHFGLNQDVQDIIEKIQNNKEK